MNVSKKKKTEHLEVSGRWMKCLPGLGRWISEAGCRFYTAKQVLFQLEEAVKTSENPEEAFRKLF